MILTVTLNPAVDKTYRTGQLLSGHINRVSSMMSLPGGKGINVSRILRQYGQPVRATGFLGGYTGKWIEEKIGAMGVECAFVKTQGDTRCSMNIVADNGYVTEILEPGPQIFPEEKARFLEGFEALLQDCELVVISGSAAPGLGNGIYPELIGIAAAHGKRVILDASGEGLRAGVAAVPYLVKPNRRELEYIAGHSCRGQDQILAAAQRLLEAGVAYVAVSAGDKGIYLLGKQRRLFARAPRIKVVNTVGCGDSACASLAMSLLRGEPMEEMLRRAVAVSAAHATTLESGSIPIELAEQLYQQIQTEVL